MQIQIFVMIIILSSLLNTNCWLREAIDSSVKFVHWSISANDTDQYETVLSLLKVRFKFDLIRFIEQRHTYGREVFVLLKDVLKLSNHVLVLRKFCPSLFERLP